MTVSGDGTFSITIGSEELARGLRPSKRTPRNSKYLIECSGAIGRDGVLQTVYNLAADRIIKDTVFPFPQLFIFTNMILVCTDKKIYELVNESLIEKLSVLPGTTWSAIESFDYVYMSNGKVAVERDALSKVWKVSSTLPIAGAMVNYNGQIMIGAPGVVQRWNYFIQVDPITVTCKPYYASFSL
jgi:hypothetical protein